MTSNDAGSGLKAGMTDVENILRTTILPLIEEEVNHGESFANLRQIYQAVILAKWYKQNLYNSLLSRIFVDRNDVASIALQDTSAVQNIYEQYLEHFRNGAGEMIKEEYDPLMQASVTRRYFTGGAKLDNAALTIVNGAFPVNRGVGVVSITVAEPISTLNDSAMLDDVKEVVLRIDNAEDLFEKMEESLLQFFENKILFTIAPPADFQTWEDIQSCGFTEKLTEILEMQDQLINLYESRQISEFAIEGNTLRLTFLNPTKIGDVESERIELVTKSGKDVKDIFETPVIRSLALLSEGLDAGKVQSQKELFRQVLGGMHIWGRLPLYLMNDQARRAFEGYLWTDFISRIMTEEEREILMKAKGGKEVKIVAPDSPKKTKKSCRLLIRNRYVFSRLMNFFSGSINMFI